MDAPREVTIITFKRAGHYRVTSLPLPEDDVIGRRGMCIGCQRDVNITYREVQFPILEVDIIGELKIYCMT